jgi:tripartite-type tricarboxylate transporter receptor subunit TctC
MPHFRRSRRRIRARVPTADEQGLKDFDAIIWYALFLPKDTPAPIMRRLNVVATMNATAVQERMKQIGADLVAPQRRSPEYLGKLVESEIAKWAGPIKASGVTAD